MDWIKVSSKIIYEPKTRKNAKKRPNPWWVIAQVDSGIVFYYNYLVRKNVLNPLGVDFAPKLHYPMWGAHVTVLDGRSHVRNRKDWKKYDGENIDIYYSPHVEKRWKFWVLPVKCELFSEIRRELGLNSDYNFHITIGREE